MKRKLQQLLKRINRKPDLRFGYCMCGCGRKTCIPKWNNRPRGWFAGVPLRYCNGHANRKMTSVEIDEASGCWIWLKGVMKCGYGRACTDDGNYEIKLAHRLLWEMVNGPIPPNLQLDHICRNRRCVNPVHLRLVTSTENSQSSINVVLDHGKVLHIRLLASKGMTAWGIAREMGLSPSTVRSVMLGHSWRNVV